MTWSPSVTSGIEPEIPDAFKLLQSKRLHRRERRAVRNRFSFRTSLSVAVVRVYAAPSGILSDGAISGERGRVGRRSVRGDR
jgi:hypothetical protein